MKKIYYLQTCSTCKRILSDLKISEKEFDMQDIKSEPLTEKQLDDIKEKAGSYEAVFSKIAMKYRQWGLNEKKLTEKDYKKYILEEYTFLRRPVIIVNDKIFVGSAKNNIEQARQAISKA